MNNKTRRFNVLGKIILISLLILACSGVGFAAEVTLNQWGQSQAPESKQNLSN